ncbi:MAG: porin family protein [Bacteroidetes bacterium]|nr:porin family protein [Bacteroidota bacterium]
MKKVILFVLLVSSVSIMYGQLSFGPKIGYTASKLTTNVDSVKTQFKSGFLFGAFLRFGHKLYLQPELYYTTHGGSFQKDSLGKSWTENITIGSLDIPVLIGFKILNTDFFNLRVLAGPVASFVVNKKITNTGDVIGPIQKASISNANWYIQAGAGVDVWMFTLDIRYQLGLNKMIKEVSYDGKSVNFNTSNNVWVISLGFKF